MHKLILTFTFISGICISLLSQKNFQTGYIITTESDTIVGQINNAYWHVNPESIQFRANKDASVQKITMDNILGFRVGGNHYVVRTVDIEKSGQSTDELNHYSDFNIYQEKVFLNRILEGPYGLYLYRNSGGRELFYVRNEEDYELLKHKYYLKVVEGKQLRAENRTYKHRLAELFIDCKTINKDIGEMDYSEDGIKKTFESYYSCTGVESSFQSASDKAKAQAGLLVGFTRTILSFDGGPSYLSQGEFKNTGNPAVGAFANFPFAGASRKLWFVIQMVYAPYESENIQVTELSGQNTRTNTVNFSMHYLDLNTMVRYNLYDGLYNIFVNAGISNGYVLGYTNTRVEETNFSGDITVRETTPYESVRNYETAFLAGLGVSFRKFALEFRYEAGNGMSNSVAIASNTKTTSLLLGYRF